MPTPQASLTDIWRNNVLVRIRPGGNMQRWTFTRADATTCATYIKNDGTISTATAGTLRTEWVDLDGDGIRETPGMLLEGTQTNLLLRSEEFDNAAWNKTNITVTANNTTAPDGTATADKVAATASAATNINQAATINSTVATYIIHAKKGSGATDCNTFGLFNNTTAQNLLFGTLNYDTGVWSYTVGSTGVTVSPLGNGWYRIIMIVTANITSGNSVIAYSGFTGSSETAGEYAYIWGACLTAGINASYIKTVASTVTRAVDSLNTPFNFDPLNLSILTKMARPFWADVTGNIIVGARPWQVGTTVSLLRLEGDSASRVWNGIIATGVVNANQSSAIPSGAEQNVLTQFRSLTTGGQVAIDTGGGLSAFSSSATAFSKFGDQVLQIGGVSGAEFYGVVLGITIARGLISRAPMMAIP